MRKKKKKPQKKGKHANQNKRLNRCCKRGVQDGFGEEREWSSTKGSPNPQRVAQGKIANQSFWGALGKAQRKKEKYNSIGDLRDKSSEKSNIKKKEER